MTLRDTKTEIMDVAEHAVRSHGANGFSYADLSDVVGIRKASIHYHFPTKDDLLTAIMERYSARIHDKLAEIKTQSTTAGDALGSFIDLYRAALQEAETLCLCVAYSVNEDGLAEDTRKSIAGFRHNTQLWLEGLFERALGDGSITELGSKEDEAAAALALVEGAQIGARLNSDMVMYDRATQSLRNRIRD